MSLVQSTKNAKERTGDQSIAVQVKQARYQIVRCTYGPRGASRIEPLTPWGSMADAVAFLDAMPTGARS